MGALPEERRAARRSVVIRALEPAQHGAAVMALADVFSLVFVNLACKSLDLVLGVLRGTRRHDFNERRIDIGSWQSLRCSDLATAGLQASLRSQSRAWREKESTMFERVGSKNVVLKGAVLSVVGIMLLRCSSDEGSDAGRVSGTADLYVGCRDTAGSIQHYRIASASAALTLVDTVRANATTSNFEVNADETFVYIAHADEGRITTFSRDRGTGTLTLENFVTVPGNAQGDPGAREPYNVDCVDADNPAAPTNPATQTLTLAPAENRLIASNWCANTLLVYEVDSDGTVGDLVQTLIDGAKSHHAVFDSTGEFVLVPYFGSDVIAVYDFARDAGTLSPVTPLTTEVPETNGSSGPRHLAFHPTQTTWLYSINETGGSISRFTFDETAGTLQHQQTISSLPEDSPFTVEAQNRSGSEIEIDQSGRFLYVSNRVDGVANGSIGVYSIAPGDGTLTPIEWEDTGGATPRHFSLSPDGQRLVVTNQGSNNMSVFSVDPASGELDLVETTQVCDVPFFARMIAR
jgi:6-phosphogluconolactonase